MITRRQSSAAVNDRLFEIAPHPIAGQPHTGSPKAESKKESKSVIFEECSLMGFKEGRLRNYGTSVPSSRRIVGKED